MSLNNLYKFHNLGSSYLPPTFSVHTVVGKKWPAGHHLRTMYIQDKTHQMPLKKAIELIWPSGLLRTCMSNTDLGFPDNFLSDKTSPDNALAGHFSSWTIYFWTFPTQENSKFSGREGCQSLGKIVLGGNCPDGNCHRWTGRSWPQGRGIVWVWIVQEGGGGSSLVRVAISSGL